MTRPALIARFMGPTWGPSGRTGPRWVPPVANVFCYLCGCLSNVHSFMENCVPTHTQTSLQWRHNAHNASQITNLIIVYSTVYSGVDQRKHESFTSERARDAEMVNLMMSSCIMHKQCERGWRWVVMGGWGGDGGVRVVGWGWGLGWGWGGVNGRVPSPLGWVHLKICPCLIRIHLI